MARTPSSYIPTGVVTRGAGARSPWGGVGRATMGRILGYPASEVPGPPSGTDPEFVISTFSVDSNGIQHLLADEILSFEFTEVSQDIFANPDTDRNNPLKGFNGYAANGFWHTNGTPDPTGGPGGKPFKATWASEGESEASLMRGDLDRFPARVFTIATPREVVLLDADTLNVWMRFTVQLYPPPGNGPFLGGPTVKIRRAIFREGFLLVATNEGLRIADFRRDRLTLHQAFQAFLPFAPTTTIVNRNDETLFDVLADVGATNHLLENDCLCLDVGVVGIPEGGSRNTFVVAAVGHPRGLTGIIVHGLSALPPTGTPLTKPRTLQHLAQVDFIVPSWYIQDDGDGDASSPYLRDDVSNWAGFGIYAGDSLQTDLGGDPEHLITEVNQITAGNRLELDPEVGLTATGTNYSVWRAVTSVLVTKDGYLYFANGPNKVNLITTPDWLIGGDVFVELTAIGDSVLLAARPGRINAMALRGDDLYIATNLGVFFASAEAFTPAGSLTAEFLWATDAVEGASATYTILEGTDTECVALVVDPETGSVMVAVTGYESVVNEVNPQLQRTFRFYDNVGRVKALVAYRNPSGPPDEEVP